MSRTVDSPQDSENSHRPEGLPSPASGPGQEESADWVALHAPFRSRRGRAVAWIAAAGQGVALVISAAILPWSGPNTVGWYDRAGFLVVAALLGWGLYRLGAVGADPSRSGLVVRNVLLTRRLEWAEILGIHFGSGDPWVLLDVSDGDSLAVMAIQRADGARATAEASRLATLVALHTRTPDS